MKLLITKYRESGKFYTCEDLEITSNEILDLNNIIYKKYENKSTLTESIKRD